LKPEGFKILLLKERKRTEGGEKRRERRVRRGREEKGSERVSERKEN
jgi:hypothetical protein